MSNFPRTVIVRLSALLVALAVAATVLFFGTTASLSAQASESIATVTQDHDAAHPGRVGDQLRTVSSPG